ncbi:MAG TPA: gluconate 2-dehydrogenase subunit 3 family protein [Saprospiraceae bacterium]|nr:gluconate 2-dehydrogenase subunit 3 family protein [Saprospiraceae bacterium]
MFTRRESIKTILAGSLGAGIIGGAVGCNDRSAEHLPTWQYGRTEDEEKRDRLMMESAPYLNKAEASMLAILVDIILPEDEISPSATAAGVPEFLQFIAMDIQELGPALKKGIGWLNRFAFDRYSLAFEDLSENQKLQLIDKVAYPYQSEDSNKAGVEFFNLLRNLTLTGFYTSKEGIQDLGYSGNRPNFWDGVPEDVLKEHGLDINTRWDGLYITEQGRSRKAEWDAEGNLIS